MVRDNKYNCHCEALHCHPGPKDPGSMSKYKAGALVLRPGMTILILIGLFLTLIVTEASAHTQRFILKNESNKLTFEFDIPKNHIIYGPTEAQTGLPTKITLTNSKNVKNHQLLWPRPQEKISEIGEKIHFYENHLKVPLNLEVIDETQNTELNFDIEYVLCSNQCELVRENVSVNLDPSFWAPPSYDSVLFIIALSLLGGFILNFMPCVLPVLSLKIISFIRHPEIDRKKSSLLTIAGIISSFWVIALIAISFKNAGQHFGLGANFQEPNFIIALILIITFFISLSLDRISFSLPNFKISKIYGEHYFSGILAVILSTPCNAPFLGSALFLSLQQSNLLIFTTFSSVSLGFSLPYIALIIWPSSLKFLPKSGKWMHYLKLILVFLLIGTLFWLFFILQAQLNTRAVAGLICLVLLFKFILETNKFIFKYLFIKIISLVVLVYLSFSLPWYSTAEDKIHETKVTNLWQKFEPDKIDSLVKEGKIVFVDIGADWCVTCKYNKYFVFGRQSVINILSDKQIIAMRGDFTNHDLQIHNFLVKRHIPGIPYNVIFGPNAPDGIELPVMLSKKDIEEGIRKAEKSTKNL